MKIKNLRLTNFRRHINTEIDFPNSGVIGITGSNEAGKSTIVEGICWALYGSEAARGTKDTLRSFSVPQTHGASARLVFEVGGSEYTIERTESNAKLFRGDAVIAESTSGVNAFIPSIVGMKYGEFAGSYLVLQKDLGRIAGMGPTQRLTFIREIMGVSRVDDAIKACRAKRAELNQVRQGVEIGLGDADGLRSTIKATSDAIAPLKERLSSLESDLEAAKAERHAAEVVVGDLMAKQAASLRAQDAHQVVLARLEELKVSANRLREQVVIGDEAASRVRKNLEIVGGIEEVRDRHRRMADAKEVVGRLAEAREGVKTTAALVEKLRAQQAQIPIDDSDYEQAVLDADKELSVAKDIFRAHLVKTQTKRASLENRVRDAEYRLERLEKIGSTSPCPTCTRPLLEHYEVVVAELRQVIQDANAELLTVNEDDPTYRQPVLDAERKLASLKESLALQSRRQKEARDVAQSLMVANINLGHFETEVSRLSSGGAEFDEQAFADLASELDRLDSISKSLVEDRALVAKGEAARDQLEQVHREREFVSRAADKAAIAIMEIGFAPVMLHDARVALSVAIQRVSDLEAAVSAGASEEAVLVDRLGEAEKALRAHEERAAQLSSLTTDIEHHKEAEAALNAFRNALAVSIRPELEDLVSGFVNALSEGRHESVEITEDFEIITYESGKAARVVSGGMEDVVALSLRLALGQMVAERAGHPISALFLDEPFGSQDESRRGALLALIRRLKGTYEQVLLISHVAETRDMVDHVIELELDESNGSSRVVAA